jgi:hypothetical protein
MGGKPADEDEKVHAHDLLGMKIKDKIKQE